MPSMYSSNSRLFHTASISISNLNSSSLHPATTKPVYAPLKIGIGGVNHTRNRSIMAAGMMARAPKKNAFTNCLRGSFSYLSCL